MDIWKADLRVVQMPKVSLVACDVRQSDSAENAKWMSERIVNLLSGVRNGE